jgi:UDP-GlcNAc:undecaprenyl-phosphate GlcNAc-1-phosphate transferase
MVFALGIIDDLRGLAAPTKFAGQILAAGFVFLGGVRLQWFRLPAFGTLSLGSSDSAVVTIVWIAVIVNAVNLIDGLHGLAAGHHRHRRGNLLHLLLRSHPGTGPVRADRPDRPP